MLPITDGLKAKLLDYNTTNSLQIVVYGEGLSRTTITEDNIVSESMALKQSICDEERIRFGGCIASEFSIQLMNTESMTFASNSADSSAVSLLDKYIAVTLVQSYFDKLYPRKNLYPSKNLFPGYATYYYPVTIFYGKITGCERQQDNRNVFNITAYDPISELFDIDVSNQLNKLFTNGRATIDTLAALCLDGIDYDPNDFERQGFSDWMQLVNHDWESNNEKITKGELLRNVCEFCAGYGFYRPSERKFRLFKHDDGIRGSEIYESYEDFYFQEGRMGSYTGIVFNYAGDISVDRNDKNKQWGGKIGYFDENCFEELEEVKTEIGDNAYCYDMTDNILAYDYSDSKNPYYNLSTIKAIYYLFKNSMILSGEDLYTPMQLTAEGKTWVEVGDTIKIIEPVTNIYGEYLTSSGEVTDNYDNAARITYTSRVLSRTLKGIKALTDTIEAKGETI